jgi:septal ring factor EnvC (AmiA/AmiB activator)
VAVRFSSYLLILPAVLLIGCASQPHRTLVRYSPPSVAPVKHPISNAQHHAKATKDSITQALKLAPSNVPGLIDALHAADHEIDALSNELLNAQAALNELETKTGGQTDALNSALDDKNAALDRNAIIERKLSAIVRQRNRILLILLVAFAWIFRGPLLGLIKLLIGGI